MARPYLPIAGTHEAGRKDSWIASGSLFDSWVSEQLGWVRRSAGFRFWSTELSGSALCAGGSTLSWSHGGDVLAHYLGHPGACAGLGQRLVIIAHSHGGQVAAFAAAKGARIPVLVTVDTPVREDMDQVWGDAVQNIGLHVHLYGTGLGSLMRALGSGWRSWWPLRRQMPWAQHNIEIAGGHSGILRDPRHMSQWHTVAEVIADAESDA